MDTPEVKTYYIARGAEPDTSNLVLASPARDGEIEFSNAWGGFLTKVPREAFSERFVEVPADTVRELMSTFERVEITLGDDDIDAPLPAITNRKLWNGWELPLFTKETLFEALEEGGLLKRLRMDSCSKFLYLAATDDLLEIEPYEGGEFENPVDLDAVRAVAESGVGEQAATGRYKKLGVSAFLTNKVAYTDEATGETATYFQAGNGWTWERAIAPAPMTAAAPGL